MSKKLNKSNSKKMPVIKETVIKKLHIGGRLVAEQKIVRKQGKSPEFGKLKVKNLQLFDWYDSVSKGLLLPPPKIKNRKT